MGTVKIDSGASNARSGIQSDYVARTPDELPVLVRWIEVFKSQLPNASILCLVLYDREQLAKEETPIPEGADYGIVAILGQYHDEEEPMTPATTPRNALGLDEGGSGHPMDEEVYEKSVAFWKDNVVVKAVDGE